MSGIRYHLTDDGPKFCTATVRECPIGGAHFASQDEANTAFEFRAKVVHSSFSLFKKKPKVALVDPHTKHLTAAAERIAQIEPELLERDSRQFNNTIFHQLEREGFSQDLLHERFQEETKTRHATIGYGAVSDQDAPVVGIVYGGDYKPEEEEGIHIISDALNAGTYEPESVKVYEKNGVTLFAVRGKDSYIFDTGSSLDVLFKPETAVLERFKEQADDTQFERRWELEQKTFKELKLEAKDLGSKALSKKDLIEDILKSERDPQERFPALGEFQNGRALVIASTDPLEIKLFHKLKEAHDGGHLRLGGSASPYGRGSLFYDDRDVSRENKSNQIRTEEAHRYANAYVSETRSKLERMNGYLHSFEPRVDASTQDVRNVTYWIDWDVVGGKRVTGLFSKEQLDRMAVGNFTDVS